MLERPHTFASLFHKYRLKAEFATLSELGTALAEKGLVYEDSTFSRWQNGNRIPHSRNILLKLIGIFMERKAIVTVGQANEFLASAHQGYLSDEERTEIPVINNSSIFQVPGEINNFSGRQELIQRIVHTEDIGGKAILLHGPAGIGKTALAIKLGHL